MSHTSPTVELTWAILSVILFVFLLGHLYHFDQFRCLRFWQTEQNGAFKKVMTYAYLISVPLIGIRSCIFASIKYKEGYVAFPGYGIIPKPYQLWPQAYKDLIFPANLCFAVAWSFEMVSHLEELCFWLFLTRTTPLHLSWFKSWNFKVWVVGSIIAVAGMPITAVLTKNMGLKNEAYICLAGSIGSSIITVAFLRVLWIFPKFIKRVKSEGAGKNVIIRLERFNQLNVIRICFRSVFVFSLLTLGVDGVLPHNHVNESAFWTDLLALSAGIGCMVSSVLTLLIFFPRSMAREAGYGTSGEGTKSEFLDQKPSRSFFDTPGQDRANPFATPEPSLAYSPTRETKEGHLELGDVHYTAEPGNHSDAHLQFGPRVTATLPLPNLQKRRGSTVHPMIMHYRSPIDVIDYQRARDVYDRYRPGRI